VSEHFPGLKDDHLTIEGSVMVAERGLFKIAELRAANPNRRMRATRTYLIDYLDRVTNPDIGVSPSESREVVARVSRFDPEVVEVLRDKGLEILEGTDEREG